MYEFDIIHNNLLEQLSKLDKCSNFILTEQQLKNASDTNQKIIKPYIGFINDKKEFINIRDFVLDKLQKYKIAGVQTGRYGSETGVLIGPGGGGCGCSYNDNCFYIIFINIHGDTVKNIIVYTMDKNLYHMIYI